MVNKEKNSFLELIKSDNISDYIQIEPEQNILKFKNIIFDNKEKSLYEETLKLSNIIRDSYNSISENRKVNFINLSLLEEGKDDSKPLNMLFNNCTFSSQKLQLDIGDTSGFTLNDINYSIKEIKFKNCIFEYMPSYHTYEIKVILEKCKISIYEPNNYEDKLECIDCFIKNFSIKDDNHNFNTELSGGTIENLLIEDASFKSKFYINKQYGGNEKQTVIKKLSIKNTVFHENFKLHNCLVEKSIIKGTDFEKHADFFNSIFKEGINKDNPQDKSINFRELNFKGLSLFGDCAFHELLKFQYVTFEDFSHFRRAKFLKGLDLDYTNIQKEMNFFDIEGLDSQNSRRNTSQETYRIIKHNFSKIGNTIEANKYHALELGKHNKNVWRRGKIIDGIVSFLFWITSNFSQNWLLPLGWMFVVGLITSFILLGEVSWSCIAKYATIVTYDDLKDHPKLFLFNKISLGFLYYQFILAVRKNTRK